MMRYLLHLATIAILSTIVFSAPNITEGEAFGFELQSITLKDGTTGSKWVPSQALLDEQQARMETFYIIDSVTNKTIRNPEYDVPLSKRANFNPYSGAECRMVFMHHHNIAQICGGGHCEDNSSESTEFRIIDHQHTGTNFVVLDFDPNTWQYFQLNGHRGFYGVANWGWDKWYAIESAWGYIEGSTKHRRDDYCWYSQGSAWWGYYGEAACSSWCSDFNW